MGLRRFISPASGDIQTVALAVLIAAAVFYLATLSFVWTASIGAVVVAGALRILWLADKRQRRPGRAARPRV